MKEPVDSDGLVIVRAVPADAGPIAVLLQANHRPGGITGHFSESMVQGVIGDMPVIVAWRREGGVRRLAGALLSSSIAAVADRPVIAGALKVYRGAPDAYIYGPVCIDERDRGTGLVRRLWERLKVELPGREGILFIRQDNPSSLKAHARLGMIERGHYDIDGVGHVVLSYR